MPPTSRWVNLFFGHQVVKLEYVLGWLNFWEWYGWIMRAQGIRKWYFNWWHSLDQGCAWPRFFRCHLHLTDIWHILTGMTSSDLTVVIPCNLLHFRNSFRTPRERFPMSFKTTSTFLICIVMLICPATAHASPPPLPLSSNLYDPCLLIAHHTRCIRFCGSDT